MFKFNEEFILTLKKNRHNSTICHDILSLIMTGRHEYFGAEFTTVELVDGQIIYNLRGKSKLETMRPGRWVQKYLYNRGYSDKDIEQFSNICMSKQKKGEVLEVVEGNKIPYYYLEYNYIQSKVGTLWKSCMRQEEKQKFFKIYVQNQERCKLLALTLDGLVQARALLWYDVFDEEGRKYNVMDRIYTTKDSQVQLFKNWAFDNGFYCKVEQSHKDGRLMNVDGHIVDKKLLLPIQWEGYDRYPYFDTFRFLDKKYNLLTNVATSKTVKLFQSTKGYILSGVWDVWNKEYINQEKGVKTYRDEWILAKDALRSEYFGFYGTPDDMIWSDIYKWVPKDFSIYSEYYETNIIKDNSVYSKSLNSHLPKENSVLINNDFYDKSQVYFSKTYNTYVFKDDVVPAYVYNPYGSYIDFIYKTDCIKIHDKWFRKVDSIEINGNWYYKEHLDKDKKIKSEFYDVYYPKENFKIINTYSELSDDAYKLSNKKIPINKKIKTNKKSIIDTLRPQRRNEEEFFLEDDEN